MESRLRADESAGNSSTLTKLSEADQSRNSPPELHVPVSRQRWCERLRAKIKHQKQGEPMPLAAIHVPSKVKLLSDRVHTVC